LNKGYFPDCEVSSTKYSIRRGAADEEIIPIIGKKSGVLISKDFNIAKTRAQYDLCKEYNLGIFFLTLPKGSDKHWEMIKLLINNWEEIIKKSNIDRKPFAFRIKVRGKMENMNS
jgi:hypothetical protein